MRRPERPHSRLRPSAHRPYEISCRGRSGPGLARTCSRIHRVADALAAHAGLLDAADVFAAKPWCNQNFWPDVIELAVGASLRRWGLSVEFERRWGKPTPDWTVVGKDGTPIVLVEAETAPTCGGPAVKRGKPAGSARTTRPPPRPKPGAVSSCPAGSPRVLGHGTGPVPTTVTVVNDGARSHPWAPQQHRSRRRRR